MIRMKFFERISLRARCSTLPGRSRRLHGNRVRRRMRFSTSVLLYVLMALPACALPVISELYYDAPGSDDGRVFVEIAGTPGTSLAGLRLEGVNGSGGNLTGSIYLDGVIGADGLFVVADAFVDGLTSSVPGADLLAQFDFQNGPDSVVLRGTAGIFDAVGYGAFGPGDVFAGEGSPAVDPVAGSSLARVFANLDRDDNALDFIALATPSPGEATFTSAPEPGAALLMGLGLGGLAGVHRRGVPPGDARGRADRRVEGVASGSRR
jgi:hypothetical protein